MSKEDGAILSEILTTTKKNVKMEFIENENILKLKF